MIRTIKNLNNTRVIIVGSGIIGKLNALELRSQGFQVNIIDQAEATNSSNAALGILMGKIYQKNQGRGWELREKSLEMWPKWINKLNEINPSLCIEKPLIQLTTNQKYYEKMMELNEKHKIALEDKTIPDSKKEEMRLAAWEA